MAKSIDRQTNRGAPKILRASKGGALVPSLIVLACIGFGSVGVINVIESIRLEARRTDLKSGVKLAAAKVQGHINNDAAWRVITESAVNGTAFSCVQSGADCCGVSEQGFAVFDQAGALVYDASSSSSIGFDLSGNVCTSYPSSACPIRLQPRWQPTGPHSLCHEANIRLSLEIEGGVNSIVAEGSTTGIEAGLLFKRGENIGSIADVCGRMGGIFDQALNQCIYRMSYQEIACVAPSCTRASCVSMGGRYRPSRSTCFIPNVCPAGHSMNGYNSVTGALNCTPIPAVGSVGACPTVPSGGIHMPAAIRSISLTTAAGAPAASPDCVPYPILPDPLGNCPAGRHLQASSGGTTYCFPNVWPCPPSDFPPHATSAEAVWNGSGYACQALSCTAGFVAWGGNCLPANRPCVPGELPPNAATGDATWTGSGYHCDATSCNGGFTLWAGNCHLSVRACLPGELPPGGISGDAYFGSGSYSCTTTACAAGYNLSGGTCVPVPPPCTPGPGFLTWYSDLRPDGSGNMVDTCIATSCNAGYVLNGEVCDVDAAYGCCYGF